MHWPSVRTMLASRQSTQQSAAGSIGYQASVVVVVAVQSHKRKQGAESGDKALDGSEQ